MVRYYPGKRWIVALDGFTRLKWRLKDWRRGRLKTVEIPEMEGHHFVTKEELERYRAEVHNRQVWAKRKAPDYLPAAKSCAYQRKRRARLKRELDTGMSKPHDAA